MVTIDYDILGIKNGEYVLDVGCGEGRHSFRACEQNNCTVCALDIDQANLAKTNYLFRLIDTEGKSRCRWLSLRGDVTRLPLRDAHFDRVICSEVLEHIPNDHQAVWELKRVLKDDGRLAVSVPTYFSEAIYWKISPQYSHQPGGHVRKYRAHQITTLLQEHGFHVYATRHKHALHTIYWLLRCIFGINRENALIPSLYHRFLVWDIKTKTRPIRLLEDLLNPFMAKSIVLYAYKNSEKNAEA